MFVAYEVSIQLVQTLRPIIPIIEMHDRDLGDQLRRAAASVVLNLSEGACSMKGNKQKHYGIANGSASEVRGALATALAWGWIEEPGAVLAVLDRLLGLLWGLTHPKST